MALVRHLVVSRFDLHHRFLAAWWTGVSGRMIKATTQENNPARIPFPSPRLILTASP